MATLIELDNAGHLFKLDPQLQANEQEWRMIYMSPRLAQWMQNDLPNLQSAWKVEVDPTQQLDALVEEFCSGATLDYGTQFHPIQHVQDGIWELKTPDLRIFGWFHVRDCFVGWRAEFANHVKKYGLYYGLAGETAHFRNQLNLNDPKFIPGTDPDAVVSNHS
jgi:hypothetical protein